MNKKIDLKYQKINCKKFLNKEFYPVWFFTNERINYFFPELKKIKNIRKVFSIGGSGDFVFSLLSTSGLNKIDKINVCDIRQLANISINLKLAIFKNLEYQEALDLFSNQGSSNKKQIYGIIKKELTPSALKIFDSVIESCKKNNFLKCLRKSGLWYRDSFLQIKYKTKYLPYLLNKERYQLLRENLEKIETYCGDFNENLKLFKDNYYDFIYLSNVLDSKEYCLKPALYLQTIKKKLNKDGFLFMTTQNNPRKMIRLIEKQGLYLYKKQLHKFKIISSLLGHYSYSFLLFKKSPTLEKSKKVLPKRS